MRGLSPPPPTFQSGGARAPLPPPYFSAYVWDSGLKSISNKVLIQAELWNECAHAQGVRLSAHASR